MNDYTHIHSNVSIHGHLRSLRVKNNIIVI